MYIPLTCVPTWTHIYANVYTTTHAAGVCFPILLNKKAYFLSLTSKLNVIPKINIRQKWVFSHCFMCSFNQYFLSTHCVQGLMLSTLVENTNGGSGQPLRSTICRYGGGP